LVEPGKRAVPERSEAEADFLAERTGFSLPAPHLFPAALTRPATFDLLLLLQSGGGLFSLAFYD
jgi:hypothetical protein